MTLEGRRLLFVLPWAELGGAERQALNAARHFAVAGAAVEVCSLTDRAGPARDAFGDAGIPWVSSTVHWYGSRVTKVRELSALARALRASRPDALLPYCTPANTLCGLVWRATGARTCVWHQQDVLPSRYGPRLVRRAVRGTPRLVANARHVASFMRELGADSRRIVVVPPLVELAEPGADRAEWRSRLGVGSSTRLVCMLGTLGPKKDHATLLRAWADVVQKSTACGGDVTLLLAGHAARHGDDAAKALAYDLELGRSVKFLGRIEDVSGLLAAVDVAVLSSRSEGMPNAVLEPMAAGLPVVATDIEGVREAVGPTGVAVLAPPGDHRALANALDRALTDEALRSDARAINPASIAERFGSAPAVDAHANVVADAIAQGRRSQGFDTPAR